MKNVVVLGGIGNGTVVGHAINHAYSMGNTELKCIGLLNDREEVGADLEGLPVIGKVSDAKKYEDEGCLFINTILRIDGQSERIGMFESLGIKEESLATFIHPLAYIAPMVEIGPGCAVLPNVSISAGTKIGKNSLIMVGATVGHSNVIGDYCHIAAQACVGSYLYVGTGVHFGLNCTIRECLTIGDYATIGMGAVLTKNVGEREIWAGNPAKFLRKAE